MLIPRFTLRWMLLVITVSGVFFLIVSWAMQGHAWAIAVSVAITTLAVSVIIQAALFVLAWVAAGLLGFSRGKRAAGSPFAQAQPPPQWIPPVEPE